MRRDQKTKSWAGKLQIQFDVISIDFAIHLVAFVADKLQTHNADVSSVQWQGYSLYTDVYTLFFEAVFLCAWHLILMTRGTFEIYALL